jgi:hypothetical protein
MTPTKDELIKVREWMLSAFSCEKNRPHDVTTIIQALDAQIKACDVPKIEGLDEALRDYDTNGSALMDYENTDVLAEAARAYHKITGGDDDTI